jgi:hypothetical protein
MKKKKISDEFILSCMDEVMKSIDDNFGKWKCKTINIECPKCKSEILRAYLEWYRDSIEECL